MPTLTLSANINGTIPGVAYNDLYLTSIGNIATSSDQQALLEQCAEASKTLLGELVFNTSVGIPYQQAVWIGVPNIQQFTAALRLAFLSIEGVTEVISIVTSQAEDTSRTLTFNDTLIFTAIIRTIYGVGTVNG